MSVYDTVDSEVNNELFAGNTVGDEQSNSVYDRIAAQSYDKG
jgi:hypothetical protein